MSRERDSRGPPSKRPRHLHGSGPEVWEDIAPSAVIHIRELPEHTLEIDLIRSFERFGRVRDVSMIPNRGQALLEFEDIRAAKEVVQRAKTEIMFVSTHRVKLNFSTSARIVHRGDGLDGSGGGESSVLLFTIYNAQYPITVEVLHQICSVNGKVLRIVIFRKAHLQAMIEFDSIEDARRAKRNLNGADIYSGCCTIKAEFARPTSLTVTKNDSETWDFENPMPKNGASNSNSLLGIPDQPRHPSLLRDPTSSSAGMSQGGGGFGSDSEYSRSYSMRSDSMSDSMYGLPAPQSSAHPYARTEGMSMGGGHGFGMDSGGMGVSGYSSNTQGVGGYGRAGYEDMGRGHGPPGGASGFGIMGPPVGGQGHGGLMPPMGMTGGPGGPMGVTGEGSSVLMVYGLNPEKTNCDRLFNLFCLYGNVIRIKFLKTKEGVCMVQMGDPQSVERCISNLNGCSVFDNKLQLQPSKQALIMDVPNPYTLLDGSPSFRDFSSNRNNRFVNVEMAQKNRITSASQTLHYWNCPPNYSESDLRELFKTAGASDPININIFSGKDKSSSGLIEWTTTGEAVEAVLLANHTEIPYPEGRFPYLIKLSFSTSSGANRGGQGRGGGSGGGGGRREGFRGEEAAGGGWRSNRGGPGGGRGGYRGGGDHR